MSTSVAVADTGGSGLEDWVDGGVVRVTGGGPTGLLVEVPAHRWDRRRLWGERLPLHDVHRARIGKNR